MEGEKKNGRRANQSEREDSLYQERCWGCCREEKCASKMELHKNSLSSFLLSLSHQHKTWTLSFNCMKVRRWVCESIDEKLERGRKERRFFLPISFSPYLVLSPSRSKGGKRRWLLEPLPQHHQVRSEALVGRISLSLFPLTQWMQKLANPFTRIQHSSSNPPFSNDDASSSNPPFSNDDDEKVWEQFKKKLRKKLSFGFNLKGEAEREREQKTKREYSSHTLNRGSLGSHPALPISPISTSLLLVDCYDLKYQVWETVDT